MCLPVQLVGEIFVNEFLVVGTHGFHIRHYVSLGVEIKLTAGKIIMEIRISTA